MQICGHSLQPKSNTKNKLCLSHILSCLLKLTNSGLKFSAPYLWTILSRCLSHNHPKHKQKIPHTYNNLTLSPTPFLKRARDNPLST